MPKYEYLLVDVELYGGQREQVIEGRKKRGRFARLSVRATVDQESEVTELDGPDAQRRLAQIFVDYMNRLGQAGWAIRYHTQQSFDSSGYWWPAGLHCFARELSGSDHGE